MIGQKWEYAGISLNTKAWSVSEVPQGLGMPGVRGENLLVPFKDGLSYKKKHYNERTIIMSMWVKGVDPITGFVPTGKNERELLYENIDYLSNLFGKNRECDLKRILPGGEIRIGKAQVCQSTSFYKKSSGFAKFTVEFELADPFFYSLDGVSETKAVESTTYDWSHFNEGTAPVTDLLIMLFGPMEAPKILNLSNNIWFQYMGSIASGESVVVHTKDFLCTKGMDNMIAALKHGGDANFFILEPGSNQLRLTNNTTGGSINVSYYKTYF